jgi:hypothetical protein
MMLFDRNDVAKIDLFKLKQKNQAMEKSSKTDLLQRF